MTTLVIWSIVAVLHNTPVFGWRPLTMHTSMQACQRTAAMLEYDDKTYRCVPAN